MNLSLIKIGSLEDIDVSLIPEAEDLKKHLLVEANGVTAVEDSFDAECAADVLRKLARATRECESARKEVKAPVLDLGKRIDAVAKQFAGDIKEQEKRISYLLGSYEAEQRKLREEAERKERARQEAAKRDLMSEDEELIKAATEALEQSAAVIEAAAHRPEGTMVRETYQFEVTDIDALFQAAPHLCKIEPDNAAIRAAIKKSQDIPGLRVWKEAKSYVR